MQKTPTDAYSSADEALSAPIDADKTPLPALSALNNDLAYLFNTFCLFYFLLILCFILSLLNDIFFNFFLFSDAGTAVSAVGV